MSRFTVTAALAAALLAVPIVARTTEAAPGSPVTLVSWAQRVGHELNAHMHDPFDMAGRERPSGVVRIKFNCSESGKPGGVAVYKSSGNPWLDRAALDAVRHVATLHPLPDGMSHQQRYVATLLFATSYEDYEEGIAKLRAEQLKSNAWFKGQAGVALLDTPSSTAG
ncbi:energy transducer TonB [uncultured Sphingomonas sp.]|uniref:energy transducer TonB family protein n=1 Tax=uncultured Sphingomonas sp. TaxID=158754 RepID=UPI0035CA3FE3